MRQISYKFEFYGDLSDEDLGFYLIGVLLDNDYSTHDGQVYRDVENPADTLSVKHKQDTYHIQEMNVKVTELIVSFTFNEGYKGPDPDQSTKNMMQYLRYILSHKYGDFGLCKWF